MYPIDLLNLQKNKENQFLNKGISTIEDLATFFPRKYYDFRNITRIKDCADGRYYALAGTVLSTGMSKTAYYANIEEEPLSDEQVAARFRVYWFGSDYHVKRLSVGSKYIFCGKVSFFRDALQMSVPLAYGPYFNKDSLCRILPIYSKIKGMSTEYLMKQVDAAIAYLKTNETKGERELFAASLGLMNRYDALQEIHAPTDDKAYPRATKRIAYDKIYDFYEQLKRKEIYLVGSNIAPMTETAKTNALISALPFPLTRDQNEVVQTIIREAKAGHRLHSLISGDVGCGKTMVAILASVFAWENGHQTIVMAPTLVLAQQHFKEFSKYGEQIGMSVGLLTTETKAKERRQLLVDFANGKINVLIGTHAVLNPDVHPNNLGLTIIDEEHKFGVAQKAKLEELDKAGVHHLTMTATPIPRSIAMTVYGSDLAVLQIQTMPAGRKAIQTKQCFTNDEAFDLIQQEVMAGHQAYIVCPYIEDSEQEAFKDVVSVASAKMMASDYFKRNGAKIRLESISGDMKQADILATVKKFEAGDIDVLVSTTIVEVGVNIPNATVIAIMSAERFGLAGLHQLRGRVGRSNLQSYCLLCSETCQNRLDAMCLTNDGFKIAEYDFQNRGPGDLIGVAQSGDSAIIAEIQRRPKLAAAIKHKFFPLQN